MRISRHQKDMRTIEMLTSENTWLKELVRRTHELAHAVHHQNIELARALAQDWLVTEGSKSRATLRVFSAEYKMAVIRAYKNAPHGHKARVLEFYNLDHTQFVTWQQAHKEFGYDGLKDGRTKRRGGKKGPALKAKAPVTLGELPSSRENLEEDWGAEDEFEEM